MKIQGQEPLEVDQIPDTDHGVVEFQFLFESNRSVKLRGTPRTRHRGVAKRYESHGVVPACRLSAFSSR